jgi:hypothetical protein
MEGEIVLEAIMLICFGVSWPASIYKSYTLKKVTGKSQIFLWLVFMGYIFGLLHKLVNDTDWVTLFYALNGSMVLIDMVLYYRYCGNS